MKPGAIKYNDDGTAVTHGVARFPDSRSGTEGIAETLEELIALQPDGYRLARFQGRPDALDKDTGRPRGSRWFLTVAFTRNE